MLIANISEFGIQYIDVASADTVTTALPIGLTAKLKWSSFERSSLFIFEDVKMSIEAVLYLDNCPERLHFQ